MKKIGLTIYALNVFHTGKYHFEKKHLVFDYPRAKPVMRSERPVHFATQTKKNLYNT